MARAAPWSEATVIAAMTLAQDDHANPCYHVPFPSRAEWCRRAGWPDKAMRRVLSDGIWRDPTKPEPRPAVGQVSDGRLDAVRKRSDKRLAEVRQTSDDGLAEDGASSSIDTKGAESGLASVWSASDDRLAEVGQASDDGRETVHTRVDPQPQPPAQPQPTTTESTSTNAPPVPARDLSGIPEALHPALHAILDRAAVERRMPQSAETCARWGGIEGNQLRGAALLQHIRRMPLPPAPEVPDEPQEPQSPPSDLTPAEPPCAEACPGAPQAGVGCEHQPDGPRHGEPAPGVQEVAPTLPSGAGDVPPREPHHSEGSADPRQRPADGPDRDTRRVAPPRWEDSDAWHAMAADYRTIAERLGGTIRRLDPSTTAGKALVALARSPRHKVCAMRLRLVARAILGEDSTPAAWSAATVWAPRDASERGWSATVAALLRIDGASTCRAIDTEAEAVLAGDLALGPRPMAQRAGPRDYGDQVPTVEAVRAVLEERQRNGTGMFGLGRRNDDVITIEAEPMRLIGGRTC